MIPVARQSERRTWVSTAVGRVTAIVLATLYGVSSATPTSPDLPPDDVASAVGVAPATVVQAAEVHSDRPAAHASRSAARQRTEALAFAREVIRAADQATAAVATATVEHVSVASAAEPQHEALPGLGAEDIQALTTARSHLSALVVQAATWRGGPTGWTRAVSTDEIARSVVARRQLSRELVDAAAHVYVLAVRIEQSLASAPAPQGVPARTSVPDLQLSAAAADAWPNGAIPLSELCSPRSAPGIVLRCDAAEALDRLADAYRAANGRELRVHSGYRTYERQSEIKRQHGALAAAPGRSNHGRGVAIDVSDMGGLGEFDAPGYLWMKANAAAFGWHHPPVMEPGGTGPKEPWHWEFGTWSGYDDRGAGWAFGGRLDLPGEGLAVHAPPPAPPVAPEPVTQPVAPPIEVSAEPLTPPVAPPPPEPSTPLGEAAPPSQTPPPSEPALPGTAPVPGEALPPTEAVPPTEETPPQEAAPGGESSPSEEHAPPEECSAPDAATPAKDGPDAEVPALGAPPVETPPPDPQTQSDDGAPQPAEAGVCEVEAEVAAEVAAG